MCGRIKNTALPITIAAKSSHWGLTPLKLLITENDVDKYQLKHTTLNEIIDNLYILTGVVDCALCGLPLQNEVLIKDGGLWVFKCGHTYHGACLDLNKIRLCTSCLPVAWLLPLVVPPVLTHRQTDRSGRLKTLPWVTSLVRDLQCRMANSIDQQWIS